MADTERRPTEYTTGTASHNNNNKQQADRQPVGNNNRRPTVVPFPIKRSKPKPEICENRSPLFPAYSNKSDVCHTSINNTNNNLTSPAAATKAAASLSTTSSINTDSTNNDPKLGWLSNQSFPSENAVATLALSTHISADSSEEDSSSNSSENEDDALDEEEEGPSEKKAKLTESGEYQKTADGKMQKEDHLKEDNHLAKKKHKSKKHKHHKKHKKHSKSIENRDGSAGKNLVDYMKEIPGKIFIEDIDGLSIEDAFRIDRKSDSNIWTYGSLYKLHIAKYTRCCKFCLGLSDDNARCLLNNQTSNAEVMKNIRRRYFSKENLKLINVASENIKALELGNQQENNKDLSKNILLFHNECEKNTVKSDIDPHSILDQSTVAYLQGHSVNSGPSANYTEDTKNPLLEKVAHYNKELHANPHNIALWLDFVSFQENFLENSGAFGHKENLSQSARSILEKKVLILEKAIEANPASTDLKIARLKLCQDLWEPQRVLESWERLVSANTANSNLWKTYLLYMQSSLSLFSVSKVTKLYHKCFKCLLEIRNTTTSQTEANKLDKDLLDVFVQYCHFLLQAGFTEKTVASFQALLEFNLFFPPSLEKASHSDCIAVFESFWDSGVGRFGEPGAQGWKYWVEKKQTTLDTSCTSVQVDQIEEDIISQNKPQWKTWLEIEHLRESVHCLPWRPDTNADETLEDCEDLDRLVLFDDIAPVLFMFHNKKLNLMLLIHSLYLLGVQKDKEHLLLLSFLDQWCLSPLTLVNNPHYNTLLTDIAATPISGSKPTHDLLKKFIDCIFQQALQVFTGEEAMAITLLWIQHHLSQVRQSSGNIDKSTSKDVRKFAKSLLKEGQNRNNLILWNAFARLEWELGKEEEALNVVETALVMQAGDLLHVNNPWEGAGICALYHTYIDILLGMKGHFVTWWTSNENRLSPNMGKSQWALIHLAEGTKLNSKNYTLMTISPTMVLKTRKKLGEIQEQIWDQFRNSSPENLTALSYFLIEFVECFALFEYCFSRLTIALSLLDSIQDQCSKQLHKNKGGSHKELLPFLETPSEKQIMIHCEKVAVKLTLYHMQHHPQSLRSLKQLLKKALKQYPSEPYFMKVLIQAERGSYLMTHLRRYFDHCLLSTTLASPVIILFAVQNELEHKAKMEALAQTGVYQLAVNSATLNRLRSLFERGLTLPEIRNCPLIWRLYISLEYEHGDLERATGIYYRSLQQCPWAKALYKDAVVMLGDDKLQYIVDLMMEKEMRIQIPVEEIAILRGDESVMKDL